MSTNGMHLAMDLSVHREIKTASEAACRVEHATLDFVSLTGRRGADRLSRRRTLAAAAAVAQATECVGILTPAEVDSLDGVPKAVHAPHADTSGRAGLLVEPGVPLPARVRPRGERRTGAWLPDDAASAATDAAGPAPVGRTVRHRNVIPFPRRPRTEPSYGSAEPSGAGRPEETAAGGTVAIRPAVAIRPVIAMRLSVHDADARWEDAARAADVVLFDAQGAAEARLTCLAMRRLSAECGREPGSLRLLLRMGVDLSGRPESARWWRPRGMTDGVTFTGTPAELAGALAAWHTAGCADGFQLVPTREDVDLPAVVEETVPELRRAGVFRAAYSARTLRGHLSLPVAEHPTATEPVHRSG